MLVIRYKKGKGKGKGLGTTLEYILKSDNTF